MPFHLPRQPGLRPSLQMSCLPPLWPAAVACGSSRTAASGGRSPAFLLFLQLGSPQQKPKRLRLVVDVSGSMYRFNGVDGRLERSMEAVCMVMEAFENYEEKFKVMGYTGEDGYKVKTGSAQSKQKSSSHNKDHPFISFSSTKRMLTA